MAMDRYSPKEPNDELCQRLREVQLEESYWFEVLEKELGVKSAKAFRYVGQESYQLLVHFVREPWEKRALYKLLNMETKLSFNEYGIKRREMLVQRQKELATIVKSLWDLTKLGKTREDEEVHEYEGEFRELLQIPENYWISDKENLIDATKKMEEMCKNIEVALRDETNWCDASYMLKTSGALKGVWVGAHSNTSAATCDMLRVPEVMHLGFPLLPPYVEQKQFKFKTEEENFLKEAEMLNDRAQNGMSSVTGGHIDKENREDRAEGTGKRREVDVKEASEENSEDPKLRGEREEEGSIVQEVEGEYYGEREVTKVESMKGGAVHKSEEQEVEERVGIIEEVEATENGKSEESATENVEGEHYHEESNETKVEGNMNEVEVVVPEARERGSEIVLHGEGKVLELKAERKVNAIDHGKQHEEVPKVMGRRGDFEDREVTREEGIKKAVKGEGQEVQERVETSAENERDENGLETMKGVIEGEEVKTAAVLTEGNNKETESIVKANNMNVCTKEEEAVNKGEEREEENVAVQCHDCKGGKNTGDKEIGEPKVEEKVGEGESVVQEETEGGSEKVPEEGGKVPELKAEREVQGAEHATQHEKVQEVKQISGNEESEATRAASMKGGVVKGEQSVEERVEIYVRGVEGAIEEKLQRQSEEGQGNSADVVTVRGSVREGGEDRSVPEADGINGSRKEDELEASNRKVEERAKDNIEAKNDHEGSTKRGVDKEIGGGTVAAEGGSDKVAEKDEKVPELKAEREEKRAEHIRQCQEVQKVKEVVGAAVDYEVRKETKAESMTVAVPKGKGEEDIEKRVEITVKKRDEKVVESMKGARLKTESEQQENGAAVVTQRDSDTVRKSEDSVAESDGSRKEDELESTANGKVEVRGKNVEGEHDHEGSTDERGVDKEIGVGVEAEVTEATEQGSEKVLEEDRKVPKSKAEREVKGAAHIRQYQEIQEVKGITVDFEDGKETRAESMKVAVPNVNCEQVIEERVELTVENERDDNVLENMEGVIEGGESDESVKEKQNRESKHDCVTYLSTVRYYFLPMASCFLVNDNLQLSDDALSHLGTIDTAIMQKKPVEDMCKLFFGRFGSHIFRGPLHFGGKLMWKCSNKGYKDAENQPIQELQMKVIDRMVTMQLDACYTETCVSSNDRNFANFPECLVGSTFVQVIVTGTSLKFIGLPDWKNCLLGSSKEWSLIDHGISPVPVWEIILMNHQTQFRNSSTLAKVLENTWEKTNNADLNAPMKVHFERVMNQGEEVSSIEEFVTKLKSLLQIKESLLQSFLDPGLWAAKYITEPCFRNFICVNVNSCINRGDNLANARELLQNLVDPVDLGITDIFSTEQHVLRSIYDRDELPLPILSEHLCTWMERIFKIALNSMCSSAELMEVKERTESPVYPQRALRGTVLIECAVHVLRNHLVKTGQCCLECLLVTLLYPFEFDPVQQKFLVLLTRSDISYLSANFAITAEHLFCQTHEINAQAYLFYLIISASDKITVRQECVIANIEYLKKKMTLCPELQTHLENLTSYKITLKQFQNEMETLFQKEEITPTATDENKEIVSKVTVTNLQSKQESLFQRLGLHEYFPQKLSLDDARGLREDILKVLHPELCVEKSSSDAVEKGDKHTSDAEEKSSDLNNICSDPTDKLSSDQALYPFILLQQIMVFDHRWTTRSKSLSTNSFSGSNSEDSDSDSDSEGPDSDIHPLDCLLALLHCCDNFLRHDLLKRLATCQLAVPLLLPHPFTQEPTLLLWALRSIVKEFKLHDDMPFRGPIVTSPIPYVSFLRIGHHFRSKSEILCNVINSSDNKRDIFLNYNSRGGTRRKLLVEGLVDMSWYLPSKSSDDLFPNAVGFVNLHGDAFSSDHKEQINVVCNVCTMHVVLLRDSMLEEDATRQYTIELLNKLSLAKGGVIILQNKPKEGLATYFDLQELKKQFTIIRMNRHKGIADIGDKIRGKICSKLEASSISLEDVIRKCKIGINIDEDNADCMKGREMAEELFSAMDAYLREHPEESPKKLLTLQSAELWHAWADADKEQYRMKRKPHAMTIDDYGSSRRKYMDEVRKKQYERAKTLFALKEKMEQAHPETMVISFLTTLKTHKGNVLWYYLLWLKSKLDDLSRKLLPQLHKKYLEKRNKLSNIQNRDEELKCQNELKCINKELISASFGLEHLLREVSQMYEAVMTHKGGLKSLKQAVSFLPQKVAQLLYDGFPIELLDGDASHMPQKWITDVLRELSVVCKCKLQMTSPLEPQIYVLSVLGLQSTGKSTLLNTLFGVQFAVSAGRCTRGVFMQLIPVHKSLQEKCGVHFFLLIDTEGLRAPEFDAQEAQKHDNELATFVIGTANHTLINIAGEVAGDMDNILETAVYAFLRMKIVELKPSCHFIHQHVIDIGAIEKLNISRLKIKDRLDTVTQTAAKEIGFVDDGVRFSDVISVDYEKDVSFFPDLWNGKLPMAHVNTGYSEDAQRLKYTVIRKCTASRKEKDKSITNLQKHLESLWKAILQEDFVFSFKNMHEITAFKCLEEQYAEWSWSLKKEMIKWEKSAENRIMGCTTEHLYTVFQELSGSLPKHVRQIHMEYEAKMNAFFDDNTEIMLKWKQDTEVRLQRLCKDIECHADSLCRQLYKGQSGRHNVEKKEEELIVKVRDRVKQLVGGILEEDTMKEEEVLKIFEESWNAWIPELTATLETIELPDIPKALDKCLSEMFETKHKFLYEKIDLKPIIAWGAKLELTVVEAHLNIKVGLFDRVKMWSRNRSHFSRFSPLAQKYTDIILTAVKRYLEGVIGSKENFKPQFVTEMLKLMQTEMLKLMQTEFKQLELSDFVFTDEYHVEMALTACGYAIPIFEDMSAAFQMKHDPVMWIEYQMKPYFKDIFVNMYNKVNKEKAAAITLCRQLEDPIKNAVIDNLSIPIINSMRGSYSWIKTKPTFVAKVLIEIGNRLEENPPTGFSCCMDFVTNTESCLQGWAKCFTESHCYSGTPSQLSKMARQELRDIITFVLDKAEDLHVPQPFKLTDWLERFHADVHMRLNIPLSKFRLLGDNQEISDANFFMTEVRNGLKDLHERLEENLYTISYPQLKQPTHVTLYAEISGCTSQCPFCKAQCEMTKDHPTSGTIKHSTQHRPECLGRTCWEKDNTMVLDICTSSVAGNIRFRNKDTNNEWIPFQKYIDYYPEWSIPADMSLEASLYWKWFLGHNSTKVEDFFGREKTKIPEEWKELKWKEVAKWLKEEYKL